MDMTEIMCLCHSYVCTCLLGGFVRKPFMAVDKATGEQTKVTPVDMTLDAVED
jgi:hypothetical protein